MVHRTRIYIKLYKGKIKVKYLNLQNILNKSKPIPNLSCYLISFYAILCYNNF